MYTKALKWSLIIVVLLSVLCPVGAYFGVVVVFITAIQARKSRQILGSLSADKAALIMLFSILLSLIYSKDIYMSLGAVFILCLNIGLYLVLMVELKKIELQKYYKLLNIACLLACIFGIYQFVSGNMNIEKSWVDEKSFGSLDRVYSTLLNPNIFAGYLAINLSFALARIRSLREDILLTSNIVLSSICLLVTYSRGGFAAFGAAMLVLCLLKERKRGLALYLSVMVAAFFVLNSTGLNNRAELGSVYHDSSSLYRLEIWKAALNMFLNSPIFGNGIGTTWYYLSSGSDKLYRYILHSHNIYLQVAAEMGIVGLCAFINLIGNKVWEGYGLLKEKVSKEEIYIIQGFIACTAGISIHGLIDAVVFVPALSLVFMGYFALYNRVISKYRLEAAYILEVPGLFNSKGVPKLLGGKCACEYKHQGEKDKAYQA
ncbi:MAG TPA: O-antigen ligase family protein [Clostridia bacterium]|nr:O-antigen ligase family protein [Clostridia bacterium]